MNYTVAPNLDDLEAIVANVWEHLPDDLLRHCEDLSVVVEDLVDEVVQQDLDLADPYDLLALYKSGSEISPGVERKVADEEDCLLLYRRPVLDLWCETGDDLQNLVKQIIIEELGRKFEFSETDVHDMIERHC